jgi:hypothetical protein
VPTLIQIAYLTNFEMGTGNPHTHPSRKGILFIFLGVFILVLLVVAFFSLRWYVEKNANGNGNTSRSTNVSDLMNTNSNPIETEAYWQTFTNAEWGITFEYPPDWNAKWLSDPKAGIVLKSPSFEPIDLGGIASTGDIYVKSVPNVNALSIQELLDTFSDSSRFWLQKYPSKSIEVGGIQATVIPEFQETDTLHFRSEIFVPLPRRVIIFSYIFQTPNHSTVLSTILSTLQILEQ